MITFVVKYITLKYKSFYSWKLGGVQALLTIQHQKYGIKEKPSTGEQTIANSAKGHQNSSRLFIHDRKALTNTNHTPNQSKQAYWSNTIFLC